MKKISQVLIESEGTRKQSSSKLVTVNTDNEIESYCALGALACENGLITKDTYEPNSTVNYYDIIKSYGVDGYTLIKDPVYGNDSNLVMTIYRLNDRKWSFKKIGKWLRKLENKGVITYAT